MPSPFTLDVPQARLDWIARRVADARIGYAPDDDADWKYGTSASYLAEFRDYWRDTYDWRAAERAFNALPQFVAEIDGIAIHFYHLRASGGSGYPLILTHGWPGSVLEFLEAMPLLAARGFDVIVPSLPGYGFSGRPPRPVGAAQVAAMWRRLMIDHLGYARFGAQGGDVGSSVSIALAEHHADVVDAFHVNLLILRASGEMSPEVKEWQDTANRRFSANGAYYMQMQTRPQTIGLALGDSPIGYASWVLEKYRAWSQCDGDIETRFTKDQLITSIMTYLVSDNVQAAMWMYNAASGFSAGGAKIPVPMGFAHFPGEIPAPPRELVDRRFNCVHWSKLPRGGHFGAWEEPELFADEVAGFFAARL